MIKETDLSKLRKMLVSVDDVELLEDAIDEIIELRNENESLEQQISDLQDDMHYLESEISDLEEELHGW